MTTIYKDNKECAVCGKISSFDEIGSTYCSETPDLDTRSSMIDKLTIFLQIQRCPFCGYCAPDISNCDDKTSEIVKSESYQKQLISNEFPELSNFFLCFSIIQEYLGNYARAGLFCIYAAWYCDDMVFYSHKRWKNIFKPFSSGLKCRKKAILLLQKAKEKNQSFVNQDGVEEYVLIDLLRRTGQFKQALDLIEEGLKKKPENIILDILNFQKELILKSDIGSHKIPELISEY